jgi:hypothetical protein
LLTPALTTHTPNARLRTSRQLWNVSERAESVTADCYAYTVGPDALVVTTSRGSSSKVVHDACEVVLEEGSALMRTGLAGMQDVLDFKQVSALTGHTAAY